uniref:Novel STAND NTPase 3 domain-containing protein n=1 Tax=Magallana gigas TaxID=29159 RepID=K1QTY1_MAGGI
MPLSCYGAVEDSNSFTMAFYIIQLRSGIAVRTQLQCDRESKINRAIFNQWQEDNDNFIPTRACNEEEKLIKSRNLVTVTGNSGSGKSATIQHIALGYKNQGWTMFSISSKMKDLNFNIETQLNVFDTYVKSVLRPRCRKSAYTFL